VAELTRAVWPLLAAAITSASSAQQSTAPVDPVVAHFREYRAALERNDLETAETAAAAALAASEAASGRRTAVLALNLANVRLELGGPRDALPPARTAYRLATSSADSGVDPVAAALTLGRAELAVGQPAGPQRLLEALAAADGQSALETDTYNAAVALGTWAINSELYAGYDAARRAWAIAARLAHVTDDPVFARARALTNEGVAIAAAGMDSAAPEADGRPRTLSPDDAKAANDAFSNALQLLRDRALSDPPSAAGPSPEQQVYAQALSWQSAALAKTQRSGSRRRSSPSADNGVAALGGSSLCAVQLIRDDAEIPYPDDALERFGVGAVVVQLGLDADGATTSATIAAPSPPGVLSVAVAAVMQDWRTQRDPSAAPTCRMPGSLFVPVPFVRD
jgi:hypothetical protein